jgi:hypothetical protein
MRRTSSNECLGVLISYDGLKVHLKNLIVTLLDTLVRQFLIAEVRESVNKDLIRRNFLELKIVFLI